MYQPKRSFLHAFTAVGLALISLQSARAQASYSYRDLGTLGGTYSSAACVNNAGQVVGSASLANGDQHPFYWSSTTGIVDIGTFGGTGGGAWGINNNSDVVGHVTNAAGVYRPFFWNSASRTITDLNTLLSAGDAANWTLTYAWKINDNRQVIGNGTLTIGGVASTHGYLLDLNTGAIYDIGEASSVDGINNLASPQVSWWLSGNAFLYSGGLSTTLSPLIRAFSVNNAGATVGYLSNAHPAYRSPAGVITDLGTFGGAGGAIKATAYSINNAPSSMVVGSTTIVVHGATVYHAFRWVVGSSAKQDLNTLTLNLSNKMVLVSANSVSDTGYIACQQDPAGSVTNNAHAFLLTPQ